jgi:glycosyltransferase involved in cell wall biosynthesis
MINPDIIIPTKNEEDYILNILNDLNRQQSNPLEKIKVIIADADSTDNTLSVINQAKLSLTKLDITIVPGGTVSVGRNNGFKLATSPYVIFIDADVRLYSNTTLVDTVIALKTKRLVTCKLKDYSGSHLSKLAFSIYNTLHKILIKKYPFAIGAYFAIHRYDFEKFGMFNENSDNSEDFLFSQNYKPHEFEVLKSHYIGQDDRRFKKMGYIGMGLHLLRNLIYFMINGRTEFTKKSKYWH